MSPKLTIEPSYWLGEGITLETVKGYKLFKFTEELQTRSDELLERNKRGNLTVEEKAELNGINELAQIFTYANSLLAAETHKIQWSQNLTENLSENGQKNGVNIAIPQNS